MAPEKGKDFFTEMKKKINHDVFTKPAAVFFFNVDLSMLTYKY